MYTVWGPHTPIVSCNPLLTGEGVYHIHSHNSILKKD